MIDFLKNINRETGVTIMVTSHDMDDLEEMAQRILMISTGKIAYDGSFNGLREITGNLTHFTVTTDGRNPKLEGCKLLSEKQGVFEFEVIARLWHSLRTLIAVILQHSETTEMFEII